MESDSKSKSTIPNNQPSISSCDTLKERFPEMSLNDDITVICDECNEYFYYGEIKSHRKIHKCLSILQIADMKSLSFKSLAKRRHKLRRQINNLPTNGRNKLISKLDSAYSTIYNFLIENHHQEYVNKFFEEIEKSNIYKIVTNKFDQTITEDLETNVDLFIESSYAMRTYAECSRVSIIGNSISENSTVLALVTGNDGDCAQKYVSDNIMNYLISNMVASSSIDDSNYLVRLEKAMKNLPIELDRNLRGGLHDDVTFNRWSSCCIESLAISRLNDKLIVTSMNIGDGTIIMVDEEGFSVISSQHSLKNESEIQRIKDMGGSISIIDNKSYLSGIKRLSQVIGGYGDSKLKTYQMPNPDVVSFEINFHKHLGIIVINSNVSNLITIQDAVAIFRYEISITIPPPEISEIHDLDVLNLTLDSSSSPITNHNELNKTVDGQISQSRMIARKIVNAALLNEMHNDSLGSLVLIFKSDKSD